MQTTRFERMTPAMFFVAGWVAVFGVAFERAQAQTVNPVPPPPPPVFNPSPPNTTMPQSPEPPVPPSSGTPLPPPGESPVLPPSEAPLPPPAETRAPAPSVAPVSAPITDTHPSSVAKTRRVQHGNRHHRLSESRGSDGAAGARVVRTAPGSNYYTPSYYFPFGWGHGWYSCVWHREWDGVWFHDCI
jgi:hypothetical protein